MDVGELFKKIPKLTLFKKGSHSLEKNPESDWRKILIGFIVVLIIILAANSYFLYKINQGDLFKTNTIPAVVDTFDSKALEVVVRHYSDKEEKYRSLAPAQVSAPVTSVEISPVESEGVEITP